MFTKTKLAVIGATIAANGVVAFAANNAQNDAMQKPQPKISIIKTVIAAEQHVNGNAQRAELEQGKSALTNVPQVSETLNLGVRG